MKEDKTNYSVERDFLKENTVPIFASNAIELLSKFKRHLIESGEVILNSDKPFLVKIAERPYYPVLCQCCGWLGSSGDCDGGGQIADTGDYGDLYCPKCGQIEPNESEVNEYWVMEPETNAVTISESDAKEAARQKYMFPTSGYINEQRDIDKSTSLLKRGFMDCFKWMQEQLKNK